MSDAKIDSPHPHTEYKNSGVPWLGKVLQSWELRRIKTLFRESDCRKGQRPMEPLSLTRAKGLIPQSENTSPTLIAEDLSGYKVCRPSDIVMNRMQAWTGMFAVPKQEGVVSPDYSVFSPTTPCEIKFFEHLFKTPILVEQFAKASKGIGTGFNRLYWENFGSITIAVPPPDEQATIVRYLDHADELINRYIGAKERLIALLEEQRQAVIHQAVTRGLDPNVPLKPSAIPQIDEIPTQWNARRLRRLANIRFSNVDKHTQDDEIPVELCNYVDVYKNDHITKHIPFMKATAGQKEIDRFRLQLEDVLITKDSEVWNDIGVPSLVKHTDEHLICGYHVAMLRPSPTVLCGRYLLRLLQDAAISYQFHIEANGVTRFGLSQDSIKSVIIPTPPVQEQETIADFLDTQTTNIQTGIERCHCQIGLIREYRTRLIAEVVTGQLDVRNAAVEPHV